MSEDLKKLVHRCLDGQTSAQFDFVQRFQGPLLGFCMRMLRQRQDAEDCTQETLVRAMKNLHRWDMSRKIEPWLFTIAGNRCRTWLARRGRQPVVHNDEIPVADNSHLYREAELLEEEVQLALSDLRDDYRIAFQLFHRDQKSYEEISQRMQVPLGTVKTWVHRARRSIVTRLAQRGVVEGEVAEGKGSELSPVRQSNSAVA